MKKIFDTLTQIADNLDRKGLVAEADLVDRAITKLAAKKDPEENKLKTNVRIAINDKLHKLSTQYYSGVGEAFSLIKDVLKEKGAVLLQEDNTAFEGMFSGREARATIDVAPESSKENGVYTPFSNTMLVLSWYKTESGKYEVTSYLS